jgi:predicted phage terminase large subunit-like protein
MTPEEAGLEIVRRKEMRASLTAFAQNIDIPGAPVKEDQELEEFDALMAHGRSIETGLADHHLLLMQKLQICMETPYGRLMVFMPPGGAKSTYCSVVAPAWYMGKEPGSRIILTSYGTDLAKKHGTKARALVKQKRFQEAFGCTLSKDTGAREMWALTHPTKGDLTGSEYMSGGLLSGITGNRANGVIIDDPIKGRAEAESSTVRQRTIEAYEDDLKTRFLPKAWMVIVQTRWHDEDLSGSILPEDYDGESGPIKCRDGQVWEILNLVAKIETVKQEVDDPLGRKMGEYLWPEWFDKKHWTQYEHIAGDLDSPSARTWAALFQQRPRPDTGNQFEREWVNWYDIGTHPKYLNFYVASDYSVSDGGGDYTEHGCGGLDKTGELWLVDWWYGQNAPNITIGALLDMSKRWRATEGFDESGVIEKAIKPQFQQMQRTRQTYLSIDYLPTIGDKVARFQSFRGLASRGQLWVPNCPWGHRLVEQLCIFPGKARDDAVDVCSLFGRGLEGMLWSKAKVPQEPKKGLKFGSWDWITHGTEDEGPKQPRVF